MRISETVQLFIIKQNNFLHNVTLQKIEIEQMITQIYFWESFIKSKKYWNYFSIYASLFSKPIT
jgi:hypothetical protein